MMQAPNGELNLFAIRDRLRKMSDAQLAQHERSAA